MRRMGTLLDLHTTNASPITLHARHLIGRSSACQLCLADRSVSGEHAVITWQDGAWWVRDLGSRNGTSVGGERLEGGQDVRLEVGAELRFGPTARFVFTDGRPPGARAVRVGDGRAVEAVDGLLALPGVEDPQAVLVPRLDGAWLAEQDDGSRVVSDLDLLNVGGETWQLYLPQALDQTLRRGETPIVLTAARLLLRVSPDEEHVEASLHSPHRSVELKPLAHWYTVLTLARARLEEPDGGWIDREQLCSMLLLDRNGLNVQLYRARRQLMNVGVEGVDELIERRGSKLRLGVTRVDVERLAE